MVFTQFMDPEHKFSFTLPQFKRAKQKSTIFLTTLKKKPFAYMYSTVQCSTVCSTEKRTKLKNMMLHFTGNREWERRHLKALFLSKVSKQIMFILWRIFVLHKVKIKRLTDIFEAETKLLYQLCISFSMFQHWVYENSYFRGDVSQEVCICATLCIKELETKYVVLTQSVKLTLNFHSLLLRLNGLSKGSAFKSPYDFSY